MYNQDIKERYIREKSITTVMPEGYLGRMFQKTMPFEEALGKDVCNFSNSEIVNLYKTWNLGSLTSLYVYNNTLQVYTQWCQKECLVVDGLNHFQEFNREILSNFVNKSLAERRVVSRGQILSWIEELPNASDGFILLAIFEGIGGTGYEEMIDLRIDDFSGNTVKLCTGRTLEVSNELVTLAEDSAAEEEYFSLNSEKQWSTRVKHDPTLIIKNIRNTAKRDGFAWRIRARMMKIFSFLDQEWMNARYVKLSGEVDFINRRARELGISNKQFVYNHYNELRDKYRVTSNMALYWSQNRDYLE